MNLDELRLPPNTGFTTTGKAPRKAPRPRAGGRFLKGPVPLDWLQLASFQPGKALHVAVYLWFLAGLTKSRSVVLPTAKLASLGVDRYAAYRAIRALETAGLVSVVRHRGRHPIVTLNDCPIEMKEHQDSPK
jgi:hypothetical protein